MFLELGLMPVILKIVSKNVFERFYTDSFFRFVSPSYANVFRSFEVILNYCLQIYLEHTLFHYEALGGMALLIFAAVAMSFEAKMKYRFGKRWYF